MLGNPLPTHVQAFGKRARIYYHPERQQEYTYWLRGYAGWEVIRFSDSIESIRALIQEGGKRGD